MIKPKKDILVRCGSRIWKEQKTYLQKYLKATDNEESEGEVLRMIIDKFIKSNPLK